MTTLLSDEQLMQQIRIRLRLGRLPVVDGVYKSHRGAGRPCIVCRRLIESQEMECAVEAQGQALHAHEVCYHLWRAVVDQIAR
jgi:hypothetical protein